MTDIIDPVLEAYAEAHTSAPGDDLLALAEETRATLDAPQMMVGALEGRFLEMLVYALRPTLGARDRDLQRLLLAVDGRRPASRWAHHHVRVEPRPCCGRPGPTSPASPYADVIEVIEGPALDTRGARSTGPSTSCSSTPTRPTTSPTTKPCSPSSRPEASSPRTTPCGAGEWWTTADQSDDTRAIRAFNDAVVADPRVVCVQATVRDGVTLIRPVSRAASGGG